MTSTECTAVLGLGGLLLLGMAIQTIHRGASPFDENYYAEIDALFEEGVQSLRHELGLTAAHASTGEPAVPEVQQTANAASAVQSDTTRRQRSAAAPGRMNINTASSAQLQRLPGIGPALAGRIIEYRTENGPFKSVSEITKVRGIGDKTLEKLAPYLFVEPEDQP